MSRDDSARQALSEDARVRFEALYERQASWDVDHPQPAIVRLADLGLIGPTVLDVGCGTGENALFLQSRGLSAWGVDLVDGAIMACRARARDRGLHAARFLVHDALVLADLGMTFDTVIDCGLFHALSDAERPYFVEGLAAVLRSGGTYHMLGFCEHQGGDTGPRRLTRGEILETFRSPFEVVRLDEARFQTRIHAGGARAWLARIARV